MGKIYNNVSELIGNTPLVELSHIEEKYDLKFHQNDEACYTVLQFTNYVVNLLK